MLTLSHGSAFFIGLILAIWLGVACWAVFTGLSMRRRAKTVDAQADQLAALLDSAPALPMVVGNDGRVEGQFRLADWFGLGRVPNFISDLSQTDAGISQDDMDLLSRNVQSAQKAGGSFTQIVAVKGSDKYLMIKGAPSALGVSASGSAVLWVYDISQSQQLITNLSEELATSRQSFHSLAALIEAAPFPMWHRGEDLRLDLVNSAYVKAVEAADAKDAIDRGLELVDSHQGRSPIAFASAAHAKGEIATRIMPATINGARRSVKIVDVPLGEAGVAGYAIDVEDLEQAKVTSKEFADTQRETLDRLSAAVVQFGRDRSLRFCNQPFQKLFEFPQDWIDEHPEFDRILDRMRDGNKLPVTRDFPAWKAERREWFVRGSGMTEENWLLPDGTHLRLLIQSLPDGGLLLIFEDRTEQVALASARDTLLRVRTATFDNLFEAVGVFEADGKLHLWNNKFRDIWGFEESFLAQHPRVDALAQEASKQLANPDRAQMIKELVRSAIDDRKQRSGRYTTKDGRHFEFAAVPLPDGNALFIILDITDSRKVETALRERTSALEAADKVKTAFVANMSYELRTPLTSIQGFAEMLEAGLAGPLEQQAKDYVQAILNSTERLGTLVDNVLDLTQNEAGGLPMEKKPVDVAELAKRAAGASNGLINAKSIDFVLDVHDTAGEVIGDIRRLRQALDHILRNALTYTQKKGRVLLHASGDSDKAEIVVSDDGPGMDSVQQAAALDRFSRAGGAGGDSALGLGLPLARQFVEMHGGSLTLISEPGVGTAVKITLPRA